MSTTKECSSLHSSLSNSERLGANSSAKVDSPTSRQIICSSAIMTLEQSLQSRGMVKTPRAESYTPIWFLSETEINLFLWRRGHSVDSRAHFDFWTDIPLLIEKRLIHLRHADSNNPFTNPFWGVDDGDSERPIENDLMRDAIVCEENYLHQLLNALVPLLPHLEALSEVTTQINKENGIVLERVILPA